MLLAFGALTWTAPVFAQVADPLAPLPSTGTQAAAVSAPTLSVPKSTAPRQYQVQTVPSASIPRDWRGVFDAIDAGNWASAQAGIAALPPSVLTPVAKAELYTAKGSPVVDLGSLQTVISQAPELPEANQLGLMAIKRGATTAPLIIPEKDTVVLGSAPVRYRAHPVQGEPAADQLRSTLDSYVKADDASGAEAQLLAQGPALSFEARAEAGTRVAFVYYVLGLDMDARRVADTWRQGATGEWASQAAWVSGLSSWRLGDYNSASIDFRQAAQYADQRELRAGGFYWAARAEQAAGRPASVEGLLKAAATSAEAPESFYGLLARETLGMSTSLGPDPLANYDRPVDQYPNVQRAIELAKIGEPALAEQMLIHQAKIGSPSDHHSLIEVAKRLDLPAAQLWLAKYGQYGAQADATDRYPNPHWTPVNGWRVDPALAFGHIVQESAFRRTAVSTAGAVGLMQVLPVTAQMEANSRGLSYSRSSLTDPRYNLEFGQSFIERMRSDSSTAGQLPRVIASYNAGPLPVARWASINDKGDPLLWIESIPYWETRYYVPSVMRNMWIYQGLDREDTPTLKAMAEHHWPAFPSGVTRISGDNNRAPGVSRSGN
ncbi:MAG TPA: lytic transglycosylase domain-containing protein [Sphingomicrobium sp.]|nr:lytic transglycosylase domain-containing protein [Sphingomicrobium sp.]